MQDLYRGQELLADPGDGGTINPNTDLAICEMTTGASNETRVLANPSRPGIRFTVRLVTDGGGDVTLTAENGLDAALETEETFADVGDMLSIVSVSVTATTYRWEVLVRNVAAVALPPGTVLADWQAGVGMTAGGGGDLTAWVDAENGLIATQTGTDGPYVPVIDVAGVWDINAGRSALQFDGNTGCMVIPSGLEVPSGDFAFLVAVRRKNSPNRGTAASWGTPVCIGTADVSGANLRESANAMRLYGHPTVYTEADEFRNISIPSNPTVMGVQVNRNGGTPIAKFIFDGRLMTVPISDYTPQDLVGGFLGIGALGAQFTDIMYRAMFFTGLATSGVDLVAWSDLITESLGQSTAKDTVLLLIHDSIMGGLQTYQTYPITAETLIDEFPNALVIGAGVSGAGIEATGGNNCDQQLAQNGRVLNNVFSATDGEASVKHTKRIVLIQAGINDIFAGTSEASIKTAFTARVTEALALGATHVYITTIQDRTGLSGGQDTIRTNLNTAIMSDTATIGHTAGINLAATDADFDDYTSDLFHGDGIHLSTAGMDALFAAIQPILAAVI